MSPGLVGWWCDGPAWSCEALREGRKGRGEAERKCPSVWHVGSRPDMAQRATHRWASLAFSLRGLSSHSIRRHQRSYETYILRWTQDSSTSYACITVILAVGQSEIEFSPTHYLENGCRYLHWLQSCLVQRQQLSCKAWGTRNKSKVRFFLFFSFSDEWCLQAGGVSGSVEIHSEENCVFLLFVLEE